MIGPTKARDWVQTDLAEQIKHELGRFVWFPGSC